MIDSADPGASARFPPDLAAALACLDQRLRVAVGAAIAAYGEQAADDPHRGLYVGDDEVKRLLARAPGVPLLGPAPGEPGLANGGAEDSPLARLARAFGLEPLDVDIVLVALAPEVDLRYERLYGYLQDDVTRRRASVDLALNLLCADAAAKLAARARFAFDGPLRRHRLVELVAAPNRDDGPLLAQEIALDGQVVRYLLGERGLDARLAGCARLELEPQGSLAELAVAQRIPAIAALAQAAGGGRLSFEGRPGSGRTRVARALASELGSALLAADVGRALAPSAADAEERLRLLVREARLHGAVLLLANIDAITASDHAAELDVLLDAIDADPGTVILAGGEPFAATRTASRRRLAGVRRIHFTLPDAAARRACWREELAAARLLAPADVVAALAGRFRLTPGQIADAVAAAAERAGDRSQRGSADTVTKDELFAAARAQSTTALSTLARKVTPRRRFEDIVLPAAQLSLLRDVCDSVAHRALVHDEWGFGERLSLGKGLSVLFSGPSGTGKTLAAEIVAGELGLELYKIDLSSVVSKFIGETEKNLGRIFDEAETTSAILFFDEADALFGKRSEVKDAHDRYANIETGYLLQKMEEYDGIVVLATNLARNMDGAFVRRMQFTIEFPLPDEAHRLRIWRGIWPAATPLCPDVDLAQLARRIELAGGHIRNIALAAAFLGAQDGMVTTDHITQATRREYEKLGQILPANASER